VEHRPQIEEECSSSLTLTTTDLGGLTAWSSGEMTPDPEGRLKTQLRPDSPLVIGRQEGGETPYLDPRYRPTRLAPGSSRPICGRSEADIWVSRGHFMLVYDARGIVLINGVPHREGGIRPPMNGTWLLEPERRFMENGENYLIENGSSATIRLPNKALILISAT
jgi:hypothetical protein